jgi:hypothetical protein
VGSLVTSLISTRVHARAGRAPWKAATAGSTVALAAVLLAGSAAVGLPHLTEASTKVPPGRSGVLLGVATVPHSSDLWVIGSAGSVDNARFFVAHRHAGRWQQVKTPPLGGRYGDLDVVDAESTHTVWIGAAKQQPHSIRNLPVIYRLSGKHWVAQKLPKLSSGAVTVTSISASSPNDAWATGGLYTPDGPVIALHWNGRKWVAIATPGGVGLGAVASVSPTDAWALSSGGIAHWNGARWADSVAAPAGANLTGIAMSSAKLGYAVGYTTSQTGQHHLVIMRFNGTTWTAVSIKGSPRLVSSSVTMHGKSAWMLGDNAVGSSVIVHTSGGAWTVSQSLRYPSFVLHGIAAQSATRAYAAGSYENKTSRRGGTYLEVLKGHSWAGVPSKF